MNELCEKFYPGQVLEDDRGNEVSITGMEIVSKGEVEWMVATCAVQALALRVAAESRIGVEVKMRMGCLVCDRNLGLAMKKLASD